MSNKVLGYFIIGAILALIAIVAIQTYRDRSYRVLWPAPLAGQTFYGSNERRLCLNDSHAPERTSPSV